MYNFSFRIDLRGVAFEPLSDEESRQLSLFLGDIFECNTLSHVDVIKTAYDVGVSSWKMESAP